MSVLLALALGLLAGYLLAWAHVAWIVWRAL